MTTKQDITEYLDDVIRPRLEKLERRVESLEVTKENILEWQGDETAYNIKLEMRVRALEETNKDHARSSDRDIVIDFLKRYPGVKFTLATVEVNTGVNQSAIRKTLNTALSRGICKEITPGTGIPSWWYDSNSQDVDTPQ